MIRSNWVPQANDPTRIVALARHWCAAGVGKWPATFRDERDRNYYRHALQTLGCVEVDGTPTQRLRAIASSDAIVSQAAFSAGLASSRAGAAWLAWAGVSELSLLDPNSATDFLAEASELSDSTANRRASTLRRWLSWAVEDLPPDFRSALECALDAVDLGSRNARKFDHSREVLGRQLGMSGSNLGIKIISDLKNYGNRISEATRVAPDALIFLAQDDLDLDALVRAYDSRALTRPPLLAARRDGSGWFPEAVLVGDTRMYDPFPNTVPRIATSIGSAEPNKYSDEEVAETIELLLALTDQPASVLEEIQSELPPRLRGLCRVKTVTSSNHAHNRVAEAIGQRPKLLLIAAPIELEQVIGRAAEQALSGIDESVRVLFALRNDSRFTVKEWTIPRKLGAEKPISVPSPGSAASQAQAPRRNGVLAWRSATYDEWNRRLFDYVFAADSTSHAVARIAATPEELRTAVGDPETDPEAVVQAFREAFVRAVPRGKSFNRVATSYFSSGAIPGCFGLLWMTCLICWGYPKQNDDTFHVRLRAVLGRTTSYTKLDEVWHQLADWLRTASDYRALELPQPDKLRTIIGSSYYLAFPHGRDRNKLSAILASADLTGRDLPVPKALAVLLKNRKRFSAAFRRDLESFEEAWRTGDEPATSAFWRAVQQEAANPSHEGRATRAGAMLVARDEDESLRLYLAWPSTAPAPSGFHLVPDEQLDDLGAQMLVPDAGNPGAVAEVRSPTVLDRASATAVRQGVLLFEEVDSWEYRLVDGDPSQTVIALVREGLDQAFVDAFGGRVLVSTVPGYREIESPNVVATVEPPPGLEDVDQLCISTSPPIARLTGGLRVPGGYLYSADGLPRIRAKSAERVRARFADGEFRQCLPGADGLWELPTDLVAPDECPAEVEARAEWSFVGAEGSSLRRTSTVQARIVTSVIGWQYKPAPGDGTFYWLEGIAPSLRQTTGGAPIDLHIATRDENEAADLLSFDGSRRFLGPGCGEFSLEQKAGFDWMAIGGWNKPDWVIFVGDPTNPTSFDSGYSADAGERRHWRAAFGDSDRARVLTETGFDSLALHPAVAAEYASRRAARGDAPPPVDERREIQNDAGLDERRAWAERKARPLIHNRLWGAIDQLAAIAQRRRGATGKEFQQLALELTGEDDFLLANEIRRAWTEVGAIDFLLRQDRSAQVIVPRRPRFLLVRDGPRVLGLLAGLVPRVLAGRLETIASDAALEHGYRPRVDERWTPPIPQVWADSDAIFQGLSDRLDLGSPLWMLPPQHFNSRATNPLNEGPAPEYPNDAVWDWTERHFSPNPSIPRQTPTIVRRRHSLQPPVYVVIDDEGTVGWTRSFEWALLAAWKLRNDSPFDLRDGGRLVSRGRSPAHLPMPLARVCAMLGDMCPGPVEEPASEREYHYPLGTAVWRAIAHLIPPHWTE